MVQVNAMGDICPIPLIKAKKAIEELKGEGIVEVLVDNEIAVQNLIKMAVQLQCEFTSRQLEEKKYQVRIKVGNKAEEAEKEETKKEAPGCGMDRREHTVVVIASNEMGNGDETLGKILIKGFLFALTQQEVLPETILFYNSGAFLTCEESASLEDLHTLEAAGVEIYTCGTCLNHYGLSDKLKIGQVTNMYVIAEKMMKAGKIVRP